MSLTFILTIMILQRTVVGRNSTFFVGLQGLTLQTDDLFYNKFAVSRI